MDIEEALNAISKKQDKILQMLTKVSKALHLVSVTEKEERAMQIAQRTNMNQAAKIAQELDDMEGKFDNDIFKVFNEDSLSTADVFADVLADDFLGGMPNARN